MKLWFCVGTAAELIKVYSLICEADKRNLDWRLVATGQSGINLWKQYSDFNLPTERSIRLNEKPDDLANSVAALKWFFGAFGQTKAKLKESFAKQNQATPEPGDYWFVHGDTLSTLIGCFYARRLAVKIVHIEAGLRSHNLFDPFPEEISRKWVSRLAHYHMAPDPTASSNLNTEGVSKNVFVTNGNTLKDTLALVAKKTASLKPIQNSFVLANIHRFENLGSETRWNLIIDTLQRVAQKKQVKLVMMANTEAKINATPGLKEQLIKANIELIKRLPFSDFLGLIKQAEFMLTDGGSNQEECFYLGKPCLIMRDKTERIEGLNSCCVLSRFDTEVINKFLNDPSSYQGKDLAMQKQPTEIVFESLGLGGSQ